MKSVWTILVVGLKELEAGKTTVARALLRCLRDLEVEACGFKPKAGNTLWYDYDVVYEGLSQGRLYGKDSKLLREASNTNFPEELITPIHRLWATPPHSLKKSLATLPYFIVDRVTLWREKPEGIVVANDALPFSHGRESLVAKLYKPETDVMRVTTVRELNDIIREYYDKAVELAYERMSSELDALVVESYADIALPWRRLEDLDMVLAVEPGYIEAYDPDEYLSAVNLSAKRQREQRTGDIVELLNPIKTIKVPPSRTEEIVSRLKGRLHPFTEAMSVH